MANKGEKPPINPEELDGADLRAKLDAEVSSEASAETASEVSGEQASESGSQEANEQKEVRPDKQLSEWLYLERAAQRIRQGLNALDAKKLTAEQMAQQADDLLVQLRHNYLSSGVVGEGVSPESAAALRESLLVVPDGKTPGQVKKEAFKVVRSALKEVQSSANLTKEDAARGLEQQLPAKAAIWGRVQHELSEFERRRARAGGKMSKKQALRQIRPVVQGLVWQLGRTIGETKDAKAQAKALMDTVADGVSGSADVWAVAEGKIDSILKTLEQRLFDNEQDAAVVKAVIAAERDDAVSDEAFFSDARERVDWQVAYERKRAQAQSEEDSSSAEEVADSDGSEAVAEDDSSDTVSYVEEEEVREDPPDTQEERAEAETKELSEKERYAAHWDRLMEDLNATVVLIEEGEDIERDVVTAALNDLVSRAVKLSREVGMSKARIADLQAAHVGEVSSDDALEDAAALIVARLQDAWPVAVDRMETLAESRESPTEMTPSAQERERGIVLAEALAEAQEVDAEVLDPQYARHHARGPVRDASFEVVDDTDLQAEVLPPKRSKYRTHGPVIDVPFEVVGSPSESSEEAIQSSVEDPHDREESGLSENEFGEEVDVVEEVDAEVLNLEPSRKGFSGETIDADFEVTGGGMVAAGVAGAALGLAAKRGSSQRSSGWSAPSGLSGDGPEAPVAGAFGRFALWKAGDLALRASRWATNVVGKLTFGAADGALAWIQKQFSNLTWSWLNPWDVSRSDKKKNTENLWRTQEEVLKAQGGDDKKKAA